MKRLAKITIALGGLLIAAMGTGLWWIRSAANSRLTQTIDTHRVEISVPWPLSKSERAALDPLLYTGNSELSDPQVVALQQAVARGRHLVQARYACTQCHGANLSGGVMVDDPAMGTWLGPNLTGGQGGRIAAYTPADWDRIVRHGVKPDGTPAIMPAGDYLAMSDRELSDIVAYVSSIDPINNVVPRPSFGPIGYLFLATGKMGLSSETLPDHHASHPRLPPKTAPTAAFGAHLIKVCTGCHRSQLGGGPITAGPPDWPPAANLTPGKQGLGDMTFDQFVTVMRTGVRPDGSSVREPMTVMIAPAQGMTDVELRALWAYLQSLPPTPTGS